MSYPRINFRWIRGLNLKEKPKKKSSGEKKKMSGFLYNSSVGKTLTMTKNTEAIKSLYNFFVSLNGKNYHRHHQKATIKPEENICACVTDKR